jgi:type I restriction enzyme M protein
MTNNAIVARLWNLCHILRDDGITYHQYVTELTYLLFLKMMQERGPEYEKQIPKGLRWKDLESKEGTEQLTFYRKMLIELGAQGSGRVEAIFAGAQSSLTQPKNLARLVEDIDKIDWYEAEKEGLGDLYEGLLEKNAGEKKSGAGQYFTPRPLISSMVQVMQPQPGELIEDPAAGTGGFLIAADRFIKDKTDDLYDLGSAEQEFQRQRAYLGMELVPETRKLGLMNLMLHEIEGTLSLGNTLSDKGRNMGKVDLVLTNPPFGTAKGGGVTRDVFTFPTNNKQLAFLQHIYRSLKVPSGKEDSKKGTSKDAKHGGRAAVVLPDNVLFEENAGTQIRRDLMDKCNLHTILRLPTGIFYAQGVKTNVLFFSRGATDTGNTKDVWVYDMRTNMPAFGKRTPFTAEYFVEFEKAFGKDPYGGSKRKDEGEEGRFRKFSREEIAKRGDNLDISWLKDEDATSAEDLPEPDVIAAEILAKLQTATAAIQELQEMLED